MRDKPHGTVSERFMQKNYGPSGYVAKNSHPSAVEQLEKDLREHSDKQLQSDDPIIRAQAAVEGVIADRLRAVLKGERGAAQTGATGPDEK